MIQCKKCYMWKLEEKSKCCCNAKPFNEKKLFKEKAIKDVSEKKQERIKDNGSEIQIFKKVFIKLKKQGLNKCLICEKKVIDENVNPSCFAHILPKGKYPEYRYFENNFGFVCGMDHHKKFDEVVQIAKHDIGEFEFEKKIKNGENIDFSKYLDLI